VAADICRPAAAEQLRQLGEQVDVPVFGPASRSAEQDVPALVKKALLQAESARARNGDRRYRGSPADRRPR